MPFVYNMPFFSILICMIGGIVTPFFRNRRLTQIVNTCIIAAVFAMSLTLFISLLTAEDSFTYMMGHFPAPWGNELRAGPFEALMAMAFSIVMFLSLVGGMRGINDDIRPTRIPLYYTMMNFLLSSMLALIYTNDMFTAYVFIEINTICACSIVMAKDSGMTVVATIRYLIMSLLGSGFFLFGVSILYTITGHLLMSNVQQSVIALVESGQYTVPLVTSLGLMVLGLAIKSALYPFHSWLPNAHGSSTTASSAILSGLVLKGYIILLVKMCYRVFTPDILISLHITDVLFVLGVLGMIMGSIKALKETHIKRMIAYSSVAQIGYIFMGIGLGTKVGIMAAWFHILAHAFTKPMLFLSANGLVDVSNHQYEMKALRGSARKDIVSGIGFTVGALSMIGIPLFAGFAPKIFLGIGSMESNFHMIVTFLALALSTLLNALYYVPAVVAFWSKPKQQQTQGEESMVLQQEKPKKSVFLLSSIGVFMVLNFVLGIAYGPIMKIITTGLNLLG